MLYQEENPRMVVVGMLQDHIRVDTHTPLRSEKSHSPCPSRAPRMSIINDAAQEVEMLGEA